MLLTLVLLRSGVQSVAKPAFPREEGGSKLLPGELGVSRVVCEIELRSMPTVDSFHPVAQGGGFESESECRSLVKADTIAPPQRYYFQPI